MCVAYAMPDALLSVAAFPMLVKMAGYGGAFEYDGGSRDPNALVKIVFVEVIFDHNSAGSVSLCMLHLPLFKHELKPACA